MSRELACLVAISIALASCRARGNTGQSPPGLRQPASTEVSSNILRGDYAGSGECASCHPEIYDSWRRSPMRGMTRNATGAAIRAPFNGAVFRFKGGRAVMETIGRQRFVRLFPTLGGEALYRVTRVIGGQYREDYVGIEVTGAADPETALGRGEERIMPVSYVLSTRSWRYKGYSVLVKERPRLQVAGVWRQTCIFCHNTVPYLSTLYDDLLGRGARGYQGSMTSNLLPPRRRWRAVATNASGLRSAVVAETQFLGGDTDGLDTVEDALAASIETTRARFGPDHLIEIGIGCESCHNGSREHVANPRRRPTFEVRSSVVKEAPTVGPASRAQSINRVCMRCHTVLFSRYPYTWEGGHRYRNPGGSNINSGEARDFVLGGCASQLSCSRCHDPHAKDDTAGLEALAGDAGNRLCTSCHAELSSPRAIAAHTHHDPAKAGSACVGCHMPRKNLGLGYRLTRYHRIGTPADPQRVERDRPLECALCHPDRDVASLVEQMERWWGRRYDRARLRNLYGDDLAVNALRITLVRGKPHEQVVAAAVLGKTGDPNVGFPIATLLAHPYPLIRHFAGQALADLYGRWPAVDLDADVDVIRSQARAWLLEAIAR